MKKVYVDTNEYLDYWLDRQDNFRPLGLFAGQVFDAVKGCTFTLVISDSIVKEIDKNLPYPSVAKEFFRNIRKLDKLIEIKVTREVFNKAKAMSKEKSIPIHDCVHFLVAKSEGALLVTEDKHLLGMDNVVKPQEL